MDDSPSITIIAQKQIATLPDGRKLSYLICGDTASIHPPILYLHGQPSSAYEAYFWHETATNLGLKVISVDRPGLGDSTYQPNRSIIDFVTDIKYLISSHLSIDTFRILSVSGGCPYALACASILPSTQLIGVSIGCGLTSAEFGTQGMGLYNRWAIWTTVNLPWIVNPLIGIMFGSIGKMDTEKLVEAISTGMSKSSSSVSPGEDQTGMEQRREKISRAMAIALKDAFKQGTEGYKLEAKLCVQKWAFVISSISPDKRIQLWYGSKDDVTPVNVGRVLAEKIPGAKLEIKDGADHNSMVLDYQREILAALAGLI